eukprot:433586-Ditylum_brightwellii.AAC.1
MGKKVKAKITSALSAALSAPVADGGDGDVPVCSSKRIKKLNLSPLPVVKPKDAASSTEAEEPPPPLS